MFDFSSWIDLPFVWGGIIAVAIFMYVFLDGFDLGCGILFPFAPSDDCRNKMMNSIAPFWDGNETWLVMGGGGLFAAFPAAYSILMPAFYIPIIMMLLGLVFRGVAFEFRFKTNGKDRKLWDAAFHGGSLIATFMQGVILGNFVQGVQVTGRAFSGEPLDWANGFSIFTGIALVFGYALLGATWLILKTSGETQTWARKAAKYSLIFVAAGKFVVSVSMPFVDPQVTEFWFKHMLHLLPLPLITLGAYWLLWRDLHTRRELRPFKLTIFIFLLGYIGLGLSIYPWIVPFKLTIWQAAAAPHSLSLLLVGTAIFLPIILGYTGYSYYIFRGKASDKPHY